MNQQRMQILNSVSAGIKLYRESCVEIKKDAERDLRKRGLGRCHIVGRGVEIIALDETGERNDDLGGPEYIAAKDLTVKGLKKTARHWLKHYSPNRNGHTISAIHLAGGFDVYDSFSDYMDAMKGDWLDYEIWADWAGQDIGIDLLKERRAT